MTLATGCTCGCPGLGCRCDFTPGGELGCQWVELEDAMRDIDAALGFRPYSVHIVHMRWTGDTVGLGAEQVVGQFEILPVPSVGDLGGLVRQLTPAQIEEVGTVLLSGVSGAYSEDQVTLRPAGGGGLPRNEAAFYEIRFRGGARRRFTVANAPGFNSDRMEWAITLRLFQGQRDRATGAPR